MLKIKEMNTHIVSNFEKLTEIRTHMRNQYKEFVEKNKVNKVFGLDSFHYQSRLLDLESKHLYEQYSFIVNRMYCDYYKLYGMVKGWFKEQFKLEPKKRSYPVYKDLEQYTLFEFTDIHNLDMDISEMLKKISEIIHKKEEDTLKDKNSKAGLNLDNYIHHKEYNNTLLRTKMNLYEKYLTSYHIYHMSFLSHLLDRVLLLFRQNTNTVKLGDIESWVDIPLLNTDDNPHTIVQTENVLDIKNNLLIHSSAALQEQLSLSILDPVPEPLPEPVTEPLPVPEPVPIIEPVPEPVPVIEPLPLIEPVPIIEPVSEPVPVSEPLPVIEPVSEPVPVIEPVSEPLPVIEPVSEPLPVIEPVSEPLPVIEPVSEPLPVIEPVSEPVPVPVIEPLPVPEPLPVLVPVPVPLPVPVPEPMVMRDPIVSSKKKKKRK